MDSNQVIWITGGGSGIGQALALYWVKAGHRVIISGRRADKLDETVLKATDCIGSIFSEPCDITDQEALIACASRIVNSHGRMDICVANAGYSAYKLFKDLSPDEWRHQMEVNFFGTIWTIRAALPHLERNQGRMAIISSVSGKIASVNTSAYSASKFALVGVCNSLYQELRDSGVSITDILPGLVESDISKVDSAGVYHADRVDRRPKRFVYPASKAARDIARAIEKRKREAVITLHGKIGVFMVNYFSGLLYRLMRRFASRVNLRK